MRYFLLLISALLVFSTGCSKKNKKFDLMRDPIETVEQVQPDIVEEIVVEEVVGPVIAEDPYTPIDAIIYFDLDSKELTQESIDALNVIKRNIKPDAELVITGETCPLGEEIYNYRLGLKRAKSAYDYLYQYLKGKIDIVCASKGEGELVNENPDEYYLNRRATIKEQVKLEY